MKINEIFRNEVEEVSKTIDKIQLEGCLKKYCDYIDTDKNSLSDFERKYVELLSERRVDFAVSLFKSAYSKMTVEELLDKITGFLYDGTYALNDSCYDDMYDSLSWKFNDADVYEAIQKEMQECLDELIEQANKKSPTPEEKREQEMERLRKLIKTKQEEIENIKDQIDKI